jgi:hypothetical protein
MRAGSADDRYPREGVIGHARWLSENSEFATDSSLEGGGFELLVPLSMKPRSGAPCGFRVRLH